MPHHWPFIRTDMNWITLHQHKGPSVRPWTNSNWSCEDMFSRHDPSMNPDPVINLHSVMPAHKWNECTEIYWCMRCGQKWVFFSHHMYYINYILIYLLNQKYNLFKTNKQTIKTPMSLWDLLSKQSPKSWSQAQLWLTEWLWRSRADLYLSDNLNISSLSNLK